MKHLKDLFLKEGLINKDLSNLLRRYIEDNNKLSIHELKRCIEEKYPNFHNELKPTYTFYRGLHLNENVSDDEIKEKELSKSYISVTDKYKLAKDYALNKGSYSKNSDEVPNFSKIITYEVPNANIVCFCKMFKDVIEFDIDEDDIIIEPKTSIITKIETIKTNKN